MDIYDHIQEEAYSPASPPAKPAQPAQASTSATSDPSTADVSDAQAPSSPTLNADLSTAFKNLQSSQWGTTLGGWFNTARTQTTTFYEELQKEAAEASQEASKTLSGTFTNLKEQVGGRMRSLSLELGKEGASEGGGVVTAVAEAKERGEGGVSNGTSAGDSAVVAEAQALQEQPRSSTEGLNLSSSDIVKEAGTLVASLRSTAASRLKDLQRAEDAADEALLKFGSNIRNLLRDAVTISAPDDTVKGAEREVLFETQEPGTGKKVVHATRLDALLHAIHSNSASFNEDPGDNEKWLQWTSDFNIDTKTEDVARDLEKYEELRRAMERLVPESVEYRMFWMRYYFLRQAVEEEEAKRKEVLKGAASSGAEQVSWDADSDDEAPTPEVAPAAPTAPPGNNKAANESTTTLNAPLASQGASSLKSISPRRSHEDEKRSVADSDASYDIVSGQVSRAPGSEVGDARRGMGEESDDDDWE